MADATETLKDAARYLTNSQSSKDQTAPMGREPHLANIRNPAI